MNIRALKTYFKGELLGYYPDTEIESFFTMLSEYILKMKRVDFILNLECNVSSEEYNSFQNALEALKNYKPIQYILGVTEFYGLKFHVNNSVLIPRPETEELVDWIISDLLKQKSISILDIGTGSGCIPITLAKHLPTAEVFTMDISLEALEIAKKNTFENNSEITLIEMNILDCAQWNSKFADRQFDVIVSNPPYVRQSEKAMMQSNVLNYEPHLALFVEDDDALLYYRAIIDFSKKYLKAGGSLYFEINEGLGESTTKIMSDLFKDMELKKDMSGKDRMIKGIKNE